MGQLRTANNRHKRALARQIATKVEPQVVQAPTPSTVTQE